MQNGKPIGFLDSVDLFADSMSEQHMQAGASNGMIIIASDGSTTSRYIDGNDDTILDAFTTALYNDEELFKLTQAALAITITSKLKADDTD